MNKFNTHRIRVKATKHCRIRNIIFLESDFQNKFKAKFNSAGAKANWHRVASFSSADGGVR